MKLTNSGFQRGYNPIVVEGDASDMNMDFGELLMEKGDTVSYNEPKECIYVLVTGKVTFRWADKEETVERKSCFHEDPILLHVPQNTAVELMCQSDKAEVSIQRTTNPKHFEPKLMKGEDLLCGSELRGAGLMNEASTRIVRTFLDRSNCPETNFFIGEVVSYPGKWSSFPHTHVEPGIYFYKFLPENGYGYAEVGDTVYKVHHNDATCMAHGVTHSQATAPGMRNTISGPSVCATTIPWLPRLYLNTPGWPEKDAKYFPEI